MFIQVKLLHVPSNREFVSDIAQVDNDNFVKLQALLKDDTSFIEFRIGEHVTIFKPNVLKECITTIIELKVQDTDRGKIIGKEGRIIKSIRTIVNSASAKLDKRATVEIVE